MKWGYLAFGHIAPKVLRSMNVLKGEELVAIASRSNADTLKGAHPSVAVYDNYEALYQDPNVEIIYISTTHNYHFENTIGALRAGKHVLCEKPMGISSAEVKEMIRVAKEENRFLMEALWTRFQPTYLKVKELIKKGTIGQLQLIKADFNHLSVLPADGRILNPKLAGGALYDLGIYPLSVVQDYFGNNIEKLSVSAKITDQGIDTDCMINIIFKEGGMAQIMSSVNTITGHCAEFYGTEGYINIPTFSRGQHFFLNKNGRQERFDFPFEATGYQFEFEECTRCIQAGKLESKIMSWNDSIAFAEMTEQIMQTW